MNNDWYQNQQRCPQEIWVNEIHFIKLAQPLLIMQSIKKGKNTKLV